MTAGNVPIDATARTYINREPDILIGVADFWRFFKGMKEIAPSMFLIKTTIGDVVCGRSEVDQMNRGHGPTSVAVNVVHDSTVPQVNERRTVEEFWDLETLGIRDDPAEKEDEVAMKAFEESICQIDGRYRVSWPWKDEQPDLPSNFQMAYSRLNAILRKLQSDDELMERYNATIVEQRQKGIIEEAGRRGGELEHYLPHHPVVTHKLRVVYDASRHTRGTKSLNDCLFRGPVILPDLASLLLRFRQPAIPVLADIEKAFLQIELHERDREVTKFLWIKDVRKPLSLDNMVIYRFRRVAFGIISSPFLLAATIRHHLKKYVDDDVARELENNTYVDNVLFECDSVEEAIAKCNRGKKIFEAAKMNLREFICNSPDVMKSIKEDDRLDTKKPKVLGIPWNVERDTLEINFPKTDDNVDVTRRAVLSTLASVFDPLGLLTPCLLPTKLFFQSQWTDKRGWDEAATADEHRRW